MDMKFLYLILVILLLYITFIPCNSATDLESIKNGIALFNNVGNGFFNLIRSRLDPNSIKVDDFNDFRLTVEQLSKGAAYYLSYYILFVLGVTFVILIPIVGLIMLCCRCCGRCGGKLKAMDPKHVRCKTITYGLLLVLLSTAMLFGIVLALFNNYIFHEAVVNEDKSVNIFVGLKSKLKNINFALIDIKQSVNKSQPVKIQPNQLQGFSNDLDNNIQRFYVSLVKVPELRNVIDQTIFFKKVLDQTNLTDSQKFIQDLNNELGTLKNDLASLKETIRGHLLSCTSEKCDRVRNKTASLRLHTIQQDILNKINKTLDLLRQADFQNGLTKIIELKENYADNTKSILEKELTYIKDHISNESFCDSVKKILISTLNKIINLKQSIENMIPSVTTGSEQNESYKTSKTVEGYRFYCYIAMCGVMFLTVLCYYCGLLFGTFGERPTEDAGCCNRGVGARFLIGAIVLTFIFSSFFMTIVIANMLTTGVVRTDICRYTNSENENDGKVLDVYLKLASKFTKESIIPHGIMDAILTKCSNENFYSAFVDVNQEALLKSLDSYFIKINNNLVNLVLSQFNLTGFLNENVFRSSSSVDMYQIANSIGLLGDDAEVSEYINLLRQTTSVEKDVQDMEALNEKVLRLKTRLRIIIQNLNNSENEFIRWKAVGQLFDNNKEIFVRQQSPEFMSSLQKSLYSVINTILSEMYKDIPCKKLRSGVLALFNTVCNDVIDPLNGTWYGIGIYLILVIPALVFACLLTDMYRRLQRFYPDKDEADYDNYIGFYARGDSEAFKNNNAGKKLVHRGYNPIPLQPVS